MSMSAAERMKNYRKRIKEDPQKYQEYLQREKDRYHKRKEKGDIVTIGDCSDREKRKKRRQWRKQKRRQRKEEKEQVNRIQNIIEMTPPNSPEYNVDINVPTVSRQKSVGRRSVNRRKAKVHKEMTKLKVQLSSKIREADKYRKRYERLKKKHSNSPKSKLEEELKGANIDKNLKRKLLFNSVVVSEIKEKMLKAKSEKQKQILSKVISSNLLKKYKMMKMAKLLNISYKRIRSNSTRSSELKFERKNKKQFIRLQMKRRVCEFLERDVNSRLLPGKKDTITKFGQKKQKRILNDTLINLHKAFLQDNKLISLSYSKFCSLRPFWVIDPKCEKRDTCSCKIHANVKFMIDRLAEHNVLKTKSYREICENICCSPVTKECMYRECESCRDKKIDCKSMSDDELGKQVWVYSWKNRNEQRERKNADGSVTKFDVQVTVKEKEYYTLEGLIHEFDNLLKSKFCRHYYNIGHQYKQLKFLKDNLSEKECVIHIDFSENYGCKFESEVQGVHFGASRNQISLHTGVLYEHGKKPQSFCTMASNTRHDASAIWAHLHPILEKLHTASPHVDTVHFISDGPTTQYRSRKNFYLMKKNVHEVHGFKNLSWNFTEAGHGKGAPDGVGGLVKRKADEVVSFGRDVANLDDLSRELGNLNLDITLFVIPDSKIYENDRRLPSVLKPVPGTMLIHQAYSTITNSNLLTRELSCFCSKPMICQCFKVRATVLTSPDTPTSLHNAEAAENVKVSSNLLNNKFSCSSRIEVREKGASFVAPESQVTTGSTHLNVLSQNNIDIDIIGQWCVVEYDKLPYIGIVQDVDHNSLEVKAMHRVGNNRFFWPMVDDIIWYDLEKVITLIPEPVPVTKRHWQVSPDVWSEVCSLLGLD